MTCMISLQSLEKACLHHHDDTKHPFTCPLNAILSLSAFSNTITTVALSKVGASSNKQIFMLLSYSMFLFNICLYMLICAHVFIFATVSAERHVLQSDVLLC